MTAHFKNPKAIGLGFLRFRMDGKRIILFPLTQDDADEMFRAIIGEKNTFGAPDGFTIHFDCLNTPRYLQRIFHLDLVVSRMIVKR